jgi:hypothetical protein
VFDHLIGKLVILDFVKPDGKSVRTIAKYLGGHDGFLEFETPTKHVRFNLNSNRIIQIFEMPPDEIDYDKLR